MNKINSLSLKQIWSISLASHLYLKKLFIAITLIIIILLFFPWFFQTIEARNGILLDDWLLNLIPAYNVSLPIFIFIWTSAILMITRAIQSPKIFLTFLWAYVLLCLSRIISISLVPLNAPNGIIALIDPLSNAFYGGKFITKDLFFSGHVATIFLMGLCLTNKKEKIIVFISTSAVATLLLIQHVHYTIDIVMAPIFTYYIWLFANKIINH